jgi:hypothetical protein
VVLEGHQQVDGMVVEMALPIAAPEEEEAHLMLEWEARL